MKMYLQWRLGSVGKLEANGGGFKKVVKLHSSWKPTWHWKITVFNRNYIFKRWMFHCHVGFQGWSCEGGPLPITSPVRIPVTHLASAMHRGPITPFISRGLPCLCVLFVDGNLRDVCFFFDVLDVTWLIWWQAKPQRMFLAPNGNAKAKEVKKSFDAPSWKKPFPSHDMILSVSIREMFSGWLWNPWTCCVKTGQTWGLLSSCSRDTPVTYQNQEVFKA